MVVRKSGVNSRRHLCGVVGESSFGVQRCALSTKAGCGHGLQTPEGHGMTADWQAARKSCRLCVRNVGADTSRVLGPEGRGQPKDVQVVFC